MRSQGLGILFHGCPDEIESARLFVRNPGKETTRLRLTVTRMRDEQRPACVQEIRIYDS
jgi:hypothetical protein